MRLVAAAGAMGATNVAIAGFTLGNGILMARLLGPTGRGSLFAMLAFPIAAAALAGSFVQPALARRAAAGAESAGRLNALGLWAALPLGLAGAALAALLVAAAGARLDPREKAAALLFAAAWTPVSLCILNLLALEMGRARWRRYNTLRLLLYPAILAGLIALAVRGVRSAPAVLAVLLGANVAVLAVQAALAAREGGFARVHAGDVRALYRDALPFLGASLAGALLAHADQLVAAIVLPEGQAGYYAVAQRAPALLTPLASAVGVVAFSRAARSEGALDGRAWERGVPLALLLLAVGLAPVVWLAVPIVFGAAFQAARGPATLSLAAGLIAALAEIREQRLEGGGLPLASVPGRVAGALAMAAVAVPAGIGLGAAGVVAGAIAGHAARALVLARVRAGGAAA